MKAGLIFSGGGGKGAYEIGVWKALREHGLEQHIQVASGTSVGALNAAMFTQGRYAEAEEFWLNITTEMVLGVNQEQIEGIKYFFLKNYQYAIPATVAAWLTNFKLFGVLRREKLEGIIRKFIDEEKVRRSQVICYATASELPLLKRTHFKMNEYNKDLMVQILLASAAIPVLWKSVSINGHDYADGGFSRELLTPGEISDPSNVPIAPAHFEKCELIFVVYLDRSTKLPDRLFPGAMVIDIVPSRPLGGLFDGTLKFDRDTAERNLDLGYADTILLLRQALQAEETTAQIREQLRGILEKRATFHEISGQMQEQQRRNDRLLGKPPLKD